MPELLRRATPAIPDDLYMDRSTWPKFNDEMEMELRSTLSTLTRQTSPAAAQTLLDLEDTHGKRRNWVWAELGWAPLAKALEHLAVLGRAVQTPLGGATLETMAGAYALEGWCIDAAALKALACVQNTDDVAAVREALRAVYGPWLEATAERFQSLVSARPLPQDNSPFAVEEGRCLLFADGLRFDVGKLLQAVLEQRQCHVAVNWRWVALPPVTSTAKPAVSPIADLLSGAHDGEDFTPVVRETGKPVSTYWFTKLLLERGLQVLEHDTAGDPTGRAWTEYGALDHAGHEQGWKLAWRVAEEVHGLAERVLALLQAGWKEVQVVTDHGWLLLPGGLPKVDLPSFLTQTRWGRCAILKQSATKIPLEVAWRWSDSVRVAMAPGIACYQAGTEYAHGGLTLQECLAPMLTVSLNVSAPPAVISSVKWLGLRCRINVDNVSQGMMVDIRTKPADSSSTLTAGGKQLGQDGMGSLVVEDDRFEGTAAVIVLLDAQGRVVSKTSTTIGGEE